MIPDNLRYHKEHEWVRVEGKQAVIGISDHAQEALGDIVFFQLPQIGAKVKAGQEIGEVESTKATSSIYTPISGTVSKVNVALNEKPELANKDPYGGGWVAHRNGQPRRSQRADGREGLRGVPRQRSEVRFWGEHARHNTHRHHRSRDRRLRGSHSRGPARRAGHPRRERGCGRLVPELGLHSQQVAAGLRGTRSED